MKRKINKQLIGIAIVGIIAAMFLMTTVFYDLFKKQVQEDLRINAQILKSTGFYRDQDAGEILSSIAGMRVTWIAEDGAVLYDSGADRNVMENHADRPEVAEAAAHGFGEDVRRSDTLNRSTFYYAILLDDGSVLRISREAQNILSVVESAIPSIAAIILMMVVICVLLAHKFTDKLIAPIEEMAENMDGGTLKPAYKELVPFANRIRAQHEDILKSAKMRQEFTANVSHELKTPLTAVSGYAELMENGIVEGEEVRRFSAEIHKNANRLLSLINDIIRLSELDGMDGDMNFESLDLYEIAGNCVENLKLQAAKHAVSLRLEGQSAMIRGSREMMYELITNLCDNAIRYNERNGWVSVRVAQEGHKCVLTVADSGIGIPREHQDRIFERFYRVDKSRSKRTGGTGLGLAIVKHIVELHDANLDLRSEVGKGTEIRITFS